MRPISTTLVNSAYRAFRIAPTAPLETSTIFPPEPAIEEEHIPDYNPHHFYPANPPSSTPLQSVARDPAQSRGSSSYRGAREEQQQEGEQEKGEGNSWDEDEGPQQEMNAVAPVVAAERAGGSPRPANKVMPSLPKLADRTYDPANSNDDTDDSLPSIEELLDPLLRKKIAEQDARALETGR
ncbi:uncharacterized protein LY89DRAFT_743963 [Mollisia scopiformis]|uniref:Uncharacterized protein n=1 Tax=Mollisia scopiformis TaxID=149040 RepID=A0A132B1U9_MOLSC|nr:uncharacterized protein LY89DRAFT_743963 [Mollisia scopiformis]KUJ06352.1 hypothetical protein LY89DRAFT_743963 [Mollisia scopiformis]